MPSWTVRVVSLVFEDIIIFVSDRNFEDIKAFAEILEDSVTAYQKRHET